MTVLTHTGMYIQTHTLSQYRTHMSAEKQGRQKWENKIRVWVNAVPVGGCGIGCWNGNLINCVN